jgi:UDP-4-amino-4,6-dideoxy-N-acetyl-beta-L-altrosamine transaminase
LVRQRPSDWSVHLLEVLHLIPYSRQSISEEDIQAVVSVLRSDFLTQGPLVAEFERCFADFHRVSHAVAVANATAGLHIACLALEVGPGSRVWTSPISFLASANCALYCGASIDFVDIDPATRNMSVSALKLKLQSALASNSLPDVLIPVDFSGLPTDLREIRALSEIYGFKILQDASHATGATYLDQPVGSQFAHASVFSFHAVKVLTTAEGGMVTTQDPELARRLQRLRSHGVTRDTSEFINTTVGGWYYEQLDLGFNFRMTDVQAALGLSQLSRLEKMHRKRIELADRYDALLSAFPLKLPVRISDRISSWHLYAIELDSTRSSKTRSEVFRALRNANIGVNVHYIPIHTQPYYRALGFRLGQFPAAEGYYEQAISLPLYPSLTEEEQNRVVEALKFALI